MDHSMTAIAAVEASRGEHLNNLKRFETFPTFNQVSDPTLILPFKAPQLILHAKPSSSRNKERNRDKPVPSKPATRKSKGVTSIYRGVTRHKVTRKYEAHLWDHSFMDEDGNRKGKQGGYNEEENAAKAYDLASLKYWGQEAAATINFPLWNYTKEIEEMQRMTREEYVAMLRRESNGFRRGESMYRGVTRHRKYRNKWQARIGKKYGDRNKYLGLYNTPEEAAKAYDIAAIKYKGINAVTNFVLSNYDIENIISIGLRKEEENGDATDPNASMTGQIDLPLKDLIASEQELDIYRMEQEPNNTDSMHQICGHPNGNCNVSFTGNGRIPYADMPDSCEQANQQAYDQCNWSLREEENHLNGKHQEYLQSSCLDFLQPSLALDQNPLQACNVDTDNANVLTGDWVPMSESCIPSATFITDVAHTHSSNATVCANGEMFVSPYGNMLLDSNTVSAFDSSTRLLQVDQASNQSAYHNQGWNNGANYYENQSIVSSSATPFPSGTIESTELGSNACVGQYSHNWIDGKSYYEQPTMSNASISQGTNGISESAFVDDSCICFENLPDIDDSYHDWFIPLLDEMAP